MHLIIYFKRLMNTVRIIHNGVFIFIIYKLVYFVSHLKYDAIFYMCFPQIAIANTHGKVIYCIKNRHHLFSAQ